MVPGAGVLASGKVTTGAMSGVVLCSPEGALDLSYCRGVSYWANATPDVMISAELAEITNCFRNGVSSGVGFGGKRGASWSGSTIAVAALSRAFNAILLRQHGRASPRGEHAPPRFLRRVTPLRLWAARVVQLEGGGIEQRAANCHGLPAGDA